MSQAMRDAIASVRRVAHHAMPSGAARAPTRSATRRGGSMTIQRKKRGRSTLLKRTCDRPSMIRSCATSTGSTILRRPSGSIIRAWTKSRLWRVNNRVCSSPLSSRPARWTSGARPAPIGRMSERPSTRMRRRMSCGSTNGAEAPLPFGGRPRRGRSSFDRPAARTAPLGEDAADDERLFDDGWDEDAPPGSPEVARNRAPLGRGVTQRRGLGLAALALAPIFVLVAGLGLGILSGAEGFDRLARLSDGPRLRMTVGGRRQRSLRRRRRPLPNHR